MLSYSWEKSSYSGGQGGTCVEARKIEMGTNLIVQLRDSQLGDASPVLSVTPSAFCRLLTDIKSQ